MKIVSRWCTESLDGMRISLDAAAFAFRIVENKGTAVAISLGHSGRGTQAVLPVVTLLQGVVHGLHAAELVIVEEPEEHLHPSAHANLADLLIACSEQSQTIVETHSENLILRLRRRIAEGRLDRNRLNLVYMRSDGLPERVELDEYGVAANWPAGVFESDVAEAQAMTDARLAALGALG
ncbi:AAA family ATPase [Micromonospora aurantiaca (nom. illeg.)]|uniref:AAA family ATPase n=1 Tax=Micromonospora aurantiaca (nom. illeg.) TaxID=47850 RepID=UPI003F49F897